jgi:hypothetical protein
VEGDVKVAIDTYMAPINQPIVSEVWGEQWEKLPNGEDSFQITFTLNNGALIKLLGEVVDERIADAVVFDEWVKSAHRLPDVNDHKLLRQMNVSGFGRRWNAMGYYAVSYFDFKDGTSYENGKVYE